MTIICFIGPSASGKSTIATEMENFGIPQIVSYTTRPMRPGEVEGVGHHFITDADAEDLLRTQRPLAYTVFGGYRYFALFSQLRFRDRQNDIVTYVIDENGYLGLINEIADNADRLQYEYGFQRPEPIQILPISIERPDISNVDAQRMARDIDRVELPDGTFKINIINDSSSVPALRAWSKEFAEAIKAYLTVMPADMMPPAKRSICTSHGGVANIIAGINDAI